MFSKLNHKWSSRKRCIRKWTTSIWCRRYKQNSLCNKEKQHRKAKAAVVDDTLNMLINELVKSSGVKRNNIVSVVASGNTTMSTLFLGIFPDYLRLEPFIPPFLNHQN